ncbi:hypothetical protein GC176_24280 [bacterium]|nr:hypothetical protein [bacterium]
MKTFIEITRHVGVGVALIFAAAAVLLWSDPRRNQEAKPHDAPLKVALLNYVSVPVLEDGEAGMLAGLTEAGFVDRKNIELTRYNAEGDRATAILIAKEVVGRDFDLVLTLSTPVLQAVANANADTKRTHVFALTTDPWGAGIGIDRADPSQHPPYMTGYGTLQPVEALFKLAREANPNLKKVGVAWNPAESNSEASTLMAREVCRQLGIELVEVTVESSSAVLEAVKSLAAREVEAIWAGGDSTVAAALDTLIGTATDAGIPLFTNMPSDVKQGALFSLGADYFEVGRASGLLAGRVLAGEAPAGIPVENFVPEQLAMNLAVLPKFAAHWQFGDDWAKRAKLVVDESGIHEEKREPKPVVHKPEAGRTYRVQIIYFAPNEVSETTIRGLKTKLAERGFVERQNIEFTIQHAQGDIALIPALMQKADQSDADLIVSLTTPCLTSASTMVRNKPVVFTEVYDPIAAGAGTSATDHLPHVTGVGSFPPLERMIDAMQQIAPGLKSVGIVYNDSEANSRKAVGAAKELLRKRGIKLEEATVTNTSEVLQAAQVLALKKVDVLWEVGDNTVNQGLEAMVKAGLDSGIPVVNSDADSSIRGALVGVGISFYESGYAAGDLAARVLLGEKPADIPFEEVAQVRMAANFGVAKQLGRSFPSSFLQGCRVFHGAGSRLGRPLKVAFVQLVEGPALDEATRGVFDGLGLAGLKTGPDIITRRFNAQGDLSQLPQIFESTKTAGADLIITSTTPAMIAAARATASIPIVYTVASYPPAVGVHPESEPRANLVGVYDDPPIAALLDLAKRREGEFKSVGTIWNPAEPNSEISVKRLRAACAERNLKLVERNASAVAELRDVTSAICLTGIEILIVSADNVTSSGFPAIHSVASEQNIPIYCTEPNLVTKGAAGAVGVDFYDWGRQSAVLAAEVLAGVPTSDIKPEKVSSLKTVVSERK